MTKTLQIPGRFRYRADFIPKGARTRRRVLMHGPMLIEIEDATIPMRRGAVRVKTADGKEVSYGLLGGRLWRPAFPDDPVAVEDYARAAQAWPTIQYDHSHLLELVERPLRAMRVDPVAAADDFRTESPWPFREGMDLYDEETAVGRVFTSDRAQSLARCLAASANVVAVGGFIHVAVPDPVWEMGFDGAIRMIAPDPAPAGYGTRCPQDNGGVVEGWRCFDVRRLDAARDLARRKDTDKPHPVEGEALHVDRDYMPPPAMARAVQDSFHYLFQSSESYLLLRHLSAQSVAAFAALQGAATCVSTHGLGQLAADPASLVAGLRGIVAELRPAMLPERLEGARDYVVRNLENILDRADFERTYRPKLDAEDDAVLGSISP